MQLSLFDENPPTRKYFRIECDENYEWLEGIIIDSIEVSKKELWAIVGKSHKIKERGISRRIYYEENGRYYDLAFYEAPYKDNLNKTDWSVSRYKDIKDYLMSVEW